MITKEEGIIEWLQFIIYLLFTYCIIETINHFIEGDVWLTLYYLFFVIYDYRMLTLK